jgi:hypothetical protein
MHRTFAHQLATIRHSEDRTHADRQRRIRQAGGSHGVHESIEAARSAVAALFSPFRPSGLSPA